MVELLAVEKRRLLAEHGRVTVEDFEVAWVECWAVMRSERAWPHATVHRRAWRKAMNEALKPEARACFLGEPTGFQRYIGALADAMDESVFAGESDMAGQLVA
jgi:hypothetical protein